MPSDHVNLQDVKDAISGITWRIFWFIVFAAGGPGAASHAESVGAIEVATGLLSLAIWILILVWIGGSLNRKILEALDLHHRYKLNNPSE